MNQPQWRKSSYSGQNGTCVELAQWPRSSGNRRDATERLELTGSEDIVGMRDSKDPDGAVLELTRNRMRTFIESCRAGDLDHLTR